MPFRDDLNAARLQIERLENEKAELIAHIRGERKPRSRIPFSVAVVFGTLFALVGTTMLGIFWRERAEPTPPPAVSLAPPTTEPPPPAVTEGPRHLVIDDVKVGTGAIAKSGDTLVTHYVGRLTSGEEFDSSRPRGQPFKFRLGAGQVIKGWEQGLDGMKVGGIRRLTIPADLAYGDRGAPAKIPPRATLIFEVELLAIEHG